MDKKTTSGLFVVGALIVIVAMASLAEAKEISITKIRQDKANTKSTPPIGIYTVSSPNFEVKEFESKVLIYNQDPYGSTVAVITISTNNSLAYIYKCVYRPGGTVCEEYPFGYATPNAPFTFTKYLTVAGSDDGAARYKVLLESYGDLNHPYYGVNVTACHYTEPTNCNSKYVQGKYSGYEIG